MATRMMKIIGLVFIFLISTCAHAGIIIGGTRLVYLSNKSDVTVSVYNKEEKIPYLVQAWVDPFNKEDKSKASFAVIPPVSRLEPLQEKVLRIIKTKGVLPEDRESVFWLNVKNIPPANKNKDVNALEIAIKTRIKLFWRPASIKTIPESGAVNVKWHRKENNLIVENTNAIHINIMEVNVDGKDVPLNMIRPFETLTLPLPAQASGKNMYWRFINDYGAVSEPIKVTL
ncbi:fimbrial chaperone [Escherichia marmotae]|nr:fimbrial chaperone [Escherichia ruysiae]MBY7362971.1 fimbrial chaperone [Escherichia ruysiae]MBY7618704.1 fimbrial chaperone [Escherichia marmotae]